MVSPKKSSAKVVVLCELDKFFRQFPHYLGLEDGQVRKEFGISCPQKWLFLKLLFAYVDIFP